MAFDLNCLRSEAWGDRKEVVCESKWDSTFSRNGSLFKIKGMIVDIIITMCMIFKPDSAEGPTNVYEIAR